MRQAIILPLLYLLPMAATAATSGDSRHPLRPLGECLAPERARGWQQLDSTTLLVDAGRRHYLIELAYGCNELGTHQGIGFASRNPDNRLCGDIGDAVLPRLGNHAVVTRCEISRITRLSGEEAAAELRARQAPKQEGDAGDAR